MHLTGWHRGVVGTCCRRMAKAFSWVHPRLKRAKRFARAGAVGATMLAMGWSHPLPAQQPIEQPGVASLQDFSGSMSFTNDGGSYLLFQKMVGDSAGVDDGFSRIGARAKLLENGNGHLFGEIHGMVTDGARFGGSAGGGYRWLMGDSLLGVNGWYDSWESGRGYRYQQAGFGAEYLSPLLDLRGNAYLPFSNDDNYLGVILDPGSEVLFFGNNIGTIGTGLYEVAQRGFDFEAGTAVPMVDWLRAYAGVYYFDTKYTDVTGFSTRAEARLGQDLNLNVRMTNDSMFGTNVTLDVEVRFNGRMPTRFPNAYDTYARRYDQVRRSWAVHTTTEGQANINVPLINPDTNNPWLITWVDNTNAGGTGTFEDPFNALPASAPGHDLILVRAGAGDTTGNIVLENNQQLLGEGTAHFIDTVELGNIQLPVLQPDGITPGFADTGAFPTLVGDGGAPIVTLADNNRVVSLNFDAVDPAELAISGANTTAFHLERLTGNVGQGIEITGASGSGTVLNLGTVDGTDDAVADPITIADGGTGLAILNDTGAPLDLTIDGFTSTGGSSGISLTNTGAGSTMNVTGSTIDISGTTDVAGTALLVDTTDAAFNGTFTDVSASGNANNGVAMLLDNATGSTTITNLTADNNGTAGAGDGLQVDMTNGTDYTLDVAGTSISGNQNDNIDISLDSSTGVVTLSDVVADGAVAGNGLRVATSDSLASGTASLDLNLNTVSFDNVVAGDAINASATEGSTLNITADEVSGTTAGGDGIQLINDGSILNLQMTNTGSFAGPVAGNGINSTNDNGGTTTINIAGAGGAPVDFSGAGIDGLFAYTGLNSTTDIDFTTGAMFDDATNHAIHLEASDATSVTLDGDNVSGSLAGSDAILVNANNSLVGVTLTNAGPFNGAGLTDANGDGLDFSGTNGSDLNINISGVLGSVADFSGAANNGVNGTLNDSIAQLTLDYTNFDGAIAGDGMVVNASNNSTFTGDITNSSFNDAAVNGINVNMNGSVGTLNLTDVTATGAVTGNALNVSAVDTAPTGTSSLDVNLDTVALDGALAGNAINGVSADGALLDIDGVDVSGSGAGASAINLDAQTGSQLDFTLSSTGTNDFTDSVGDGVTFIATDASTLNLDISNTNFDDTVAGGHGLNGQATDSTVTVNLQDVTFNNADLNGVFLFGTNSSITGTLDTVTANDAGLNAFALQVDTNAIANLTINNFTGTNAGVDAVNVWAQSGSDVDLTMDNIIGTGAGQGAVDGDGFDITADGALTDVNVVITNSNFNDAFNNGLEVIFSNSANVVFDATGGNVTFDNAGQSAAVAGQGDGIHIEGNTGATADVHITSGSVLNAFDDQTEAILLGGSTGTVVIDPTTATGAGDNGVQFDVQDGSTFNYTAGTFGATSPDSPVSTAADPVGNNGVFGTMDNGTVNLTFNSSDINSDGTSTGSGINVSGSNASEFNLTLNNSNVTGWANGNGIIVAMEDSNATLNLNGADVSGAGADAISVSSTTGASILQSGSTVELNLGTGANLNDAGSSALFLSANGTGSSLTATGDATTGDNAGDDAVQVITDNGAIANLTLTSVNGATSFQNAGQGNLGGSGLNLSAANGSGIIADVSGVSGTPVNFDNAYNFGVNALAASGSSIQLTLDEFTASNAGTATGGGGINLQADGAGSSISNSSITNGVIQDSGNNTVDGSFGIRVTATNGAAIGTELTSVAGIDFENLTIGNTDPLNMTQDTGVILNADGDSYLGATFTDVDLDFNQTGGMVVNVNADASAMDQSFLEFTYTGGSISNNGGDGVVLNATNGDNPLLPVQSTGINAGFQDTAIQYNANSFAHPVTPGTLPDPGNDTPDDIGYGIRLNADNNMITITYDKVDLSENEEGAVLANATNGGIIVQNFANMTLNDPVIICADGAGSFAAASLNNVTIENITGDNAAIAMCALNGGQSYGDFTDVTIRNVEAQAFAFISDGTDGVNPSILEATFDNLTINNVAYGTPGVTLDTDTGLLLHAVMQGQVSNNGTAQIVMTDVTITDSDPLSVTDVNAMDIDVLSGGQLDLLIDGFTVDSATPTATTAQAGEGEIDLRVEGSGLAASSATFDLSDITIDDSDARGLNITGDALGLLNFTDLDLNGVTMDNISANNAAENGLHIDGNLRTDLAITNSSFNDAGGVGVRIGVDTIAATEVSLTNVTANDAQGFAGVVAFINSNGTGDQTISFDNVQADGAVNGHGAYLTLNGLGSGATGAFNITNGSSFDDAANNGIDVQFNGAADSLGTLTVSDTTATGAGGDGLVITPSGTTDVTAVTLTNLDVTGAGGNGVDIQLADQVNGTNITLDGVTANDTGSLAIDLGLTNIDGDSSVSLTNVTADNTGGAFTGGGIDITMSGVTNSGGAGTQSITLDGVSAQNAQGVDGLNINVNLLADADDDIAISIDNTVSGVTNNFSGADGDGVNILLNGAAGSTGSVHVEDVIANNVGGIGVDVNVTGGITVDMGSSFNNITATNAGEEGLNITSDAASTITAIRGTNNNFDGAGQSGPGFDGINMDIGAQSTPIIIEFSDTSANGASGAGVDINLTSIGGDSSITLNNVDATDSEAGDGLNITAALQTNADLGITLTGGSDYSRSFGDGVSLNVTGDATNEIDLSVDGVTSNDNSTGDATFNEDGFVLTVSSGSTVNINDFANLSTTGNDGDGIRMAFDANTVNFDASSTGIFENITTTGNQQNGLLLSFINGSSTSFQGVAGDAVVIDGIDLSGNGQAGDFDGLRMTVDNSTAAFQFNELTSNNNGGSGASLSVTGGSDVTFNIVNTLGGTMNNSGFDGLDIDVDGSTLTSLIQGLTVSNSGTQVVPVNDGVNVQIINGSTADITFDGVTSSNNDNDGFDIDVLSGSDAIVNIQNGTTGNNNGNTANSLNSGLGLNFNADTTGNVSLTMDSTGGANTFSNNDGTGVLVNLAGTTVVDDLTIDATASGNGGNGVEIQVASGVDFTATGTINANNIIANNNADNGLLIDIDGNNTIMDFTLQNASFSGNGEDQVHLAFSNMTALDSIDINTVTVTGTAGSGDGLEINLQDADLATGLNITALTATNNAESGLQVTAHNSNIPLMQITGSSFTGNGASYNRGDAPGPNDYFGGATLAFTGDSIVDLDIFQNDQGAGTGFSNNTGLGLAILVQGTSDFTMNTMFDNRIQNNNGFGFYFEASEPGEAASNGIGPVYNLALGDTAFDPNEITGNADAAVAIVGRNDSEGTFTIENSILSGTRNGLAGDDVNFSGEGLSILLTNEAELTSLFLDGDTTGGATGIVINGNAGSGLRTDLRNNSLIGSYEVTNATIQNNGRHGINVLRSGEGTYNGGIDINNSTLRNNTLNGINIEHNNDPVSGPLLVSITENLFDSNVQDGVMITGRGNAVIQGEISDNTFLSQGRHGIHVRLENDSQLGDLTQTLAAGAFNMLGNTITGNSSPATGDGIHLDINRSVGSTTPGLQASAFANVYISDSATNESVISGKSNGIQILDNSSYVGTGGNLAQNSYVVESIDITNNVRDGIHIEQNTTNATDPFTLDGGIYVNIFGTPGLASQDMVISGNGDDGIDMRFNSAPVDIDSGDGIANLVDLADLRLFANGLNGDGNGGHNIEVRFANNTGARSGGGTINFTGRTTIDGDGISDDGINIVSTGTRMVGSDGNSNGVANENIIVNMVGVSSTNNTGRGMYVEMAHDASSGSDANKSLFNIGLAAAGGGLYDNGTYNTFSNNAQEGFIFYTRAQSISQNNGNPGDNNGDIEVVSGLNNPFGATAISTTQTGYQALNSIASGEETRTRVLSTINFYNNEVENNTRDGLVLSVGTQTRMNAAIAGNYFTGNNEDVNIFVVVSANPGDSHNDGSANLDRLVYDPVAYLDLVLGTADTNGDGIIDGTDTYLPNYINPGDFLYNNRGIAATSSITASGLFTNNDPFKGNNRQAALVTQVRTTGDNGGTGLPDWEEAFLDAADLTTIIDITPFFPAAFTDFEIDGVAFPEAPLFIPNSGAATFATP